MRPEGDGFKNYFTVAYQVLHGTSPIDFEGLIYPYGDTIFYTDCQPIVMWLMQILHFLGWKNIPVIGILNYLQFFNILLSVYLLYKLLTSFKVTEWIAAIGSISITLASPQLARIHYGHYALVYTFVPILFIYLLLTIKPCYYKKYIIGITLILVSLLHMYYFLIIGGWLAIYQLIQFAKNRKAIDFSKNLTVQILIPGAFLLSLVKLTDSITDRPGSPDGFLWYRSKLEGIFLPTGTKIADWFSEHIFHISSPPTFEGDAFIGPLAVIFCCVAIYYLLKTKGRLLVVRNLSDYKILLISSIPILLFSFGWPFVFNPNLEPLIDYLGFIKQFRAIGRFAWPFYYMINIAAIIWLSKRPMKLKSTLLLQIVFVIYFIFITSVSIKQAQITQNKRYTLTETAFLNLNITPTDYQAILPLPIYHGGSEFYYKYDAVQFKEHVGNSMEVSIGTGLPIFSNHLSRSSLSQTNNYMDFIYGEMNETFTSKFNNKPFLVLRTKSAPLTKAEERLFNLSTVLFENKKLSLGVLSAKTFKEFKIDQPKKLDFTPLAQITKKIISFKEEKEPVVSSVNFDKDNFSKVGIEFRLPIPKNTDQILSGMIIKYYNDDALLKTDRFPTHQYHSWKDEKAYYFSIKKDIPTSTNSIEIFITSRSRLNQILLENIFIGVK